MNKEVRTKLLSQQERIKRLVTLSSQKIKFNLFQSIHGQLHIFALSTRQDISCVASQLSQVEQVAVSKKNVDYNNSVVNFPTDALVTHFRYAPVR